MQQKGKDAPCCLSAPLSAQHPPYFGHSPQPSSHRAVPRRVLDSSDCRADRPMLGVSAASRHIALGSLCSASLLPEPAVELLTSLFLFPCPCSPLRSWAFTPSPSGWPWKRWRTSPGSSRATAPCPTSTSCITHCHLAAVRWACPWGAAPTGPPRLLPRPGASRRQLAGGPGLGGAGLPALKF